MKRHPSALALAAMLVSASLGYAQPPAAPQGGNPTKAEGTVLKNKAPVNKEVLRVKLPKPTEMDLSNGVHLIVLEDHRTPQVTFQMIIDGAGGYYDPPDMPGLAGFTAALMREGTVTKTSEQISEQLDRLAAGVNVGAGISSPFATVSGSGLTNNLDTVLALMADVLMNPSFPQVEIDRYKTRTRAGLMQQRTQPGFLASERLNKAVFGDHPLARVSAAPESVNALTRDALVARPNSVQTSLRIGTQSIERTNPDYEALTVANRILGGPFGRLFEHLREQKGYTYGAGSGFNASRIRGSWTASTDVRSEVTDPALTDLIDEIKQMREKPVTEKELNDAKKAIVGSFALLLESPGAILNNYIDRYIYKLPADYWDTYASRIEAVTPADIQRVAQKYWAPDRLQIVAVGELAKVEPALKKLGTVQVFDLDGKPMK